MDNVLMRSESLRQGLRGTCSCESFPFVWYGVSCAMTRLCLNTGTGTSFTMPEQVADGSGFLHIRTRVFPTSLPSVGWV